MSPYDPQAPDDDQWDSGWADPDWVDPFEPDWPDWLAGPEYLMWLARLQEESE